MSADTDNLRVLAKVLYIRTAGDKEMGLITDAANELDAIRAECDRLKHACQQAVEWLDGWASAEPYISILNAALQKETLR